MKDKVRDGALRFLCDVERDKKYTNIALGGALAAFSEERDRALFTALVYGVQEKKITLDYYISRLSSRPLSELERFTKNILRLGLYQMIYMQTPPHAAVNETVSLARQRGERGFINACLREFLRKEIPLPAKEEGLIPYLSVNYAFPEWICRRFCEDYGDETAEELLIAANKKPPLYLTVNSERTTREELISALNAQFESEGIDCKAEEANFSPVSIKLTGDVKVPALYGFDCGLFYVQDEASALVSEVLMPKAGDKVVDACSCPGSKSFSAALKMKNGGKIYSFDIHRNKLSLVDNMAEKLGITIIETGTQDARTPRTKLKNKCDCVICDVPCSGLGVTAKKPDLRHKEEEDILSLPQMGLSILTASSTYLKKGGEMIFSTCTLLKDENERTVEAFLKDNPEFIPVDFEIKGKNGLVLSSRCGMLTLLPHVTETDGFFIAKLRRI